MTIAQPQVPVPLDAGQTSAPASHTPGPWEWDWRYDEERAEADCGVFTVGRSISLGHAYAVARCPRYQSRERWEADARLIAAAPDLLEALTEVMDALRIHAPGTPLNNHRFDALGIKAHAAINKAEGR